MTKPANRAIRHNQGKVDLSLLPRIAALEECKVWMDGEDEYGRNNWKKLWGDDTINVAMASLLRHALKTIDGELFDKKSGRPHAAHIRCNAAMILLWMAKKGLIDPEVYVKSGERKQRKKKGKK